MTLGEEHLEFWFSQPIANLSFVYVIQGDDPPIKVGVAVNPVRRLAGLQTGNPQKLRLLYVLPGGRDLEWELHKKLKDSQVHGEWFDGPRVSDVLRTVEWLSQRLVDLYDGSDTAPSFKEVQLDWKGRVHKRRPKKHPVEVRFVEPDPVPEDEALANLKAHWLRRRKPGEVWDINAEAMTTPTTIS